MLLMTFKLSLRPMNQGACVATPFFLNDPLSSDG